MQLTSALGIPDWRLDKFTSLYYQLISQDKLLLDDGLAEEEIKQLYLLHPTCQQLCDMLSKHDIPETLSHSDFQENNMLLDEKTGSINISIYSPHFECFRRKVRFECRLRDLDAPNMAFP